MAIPRRRIDTPAALRTASLHEAAFHMVLHCILRPTEPKARLLDEPMTSFSLPIRYTDRVEVT